MYLVTASNMYENYSEDFVILEVARAYARQMAADGYDDVYIYTLLEEVVDGERKHREELAQFDGILGMDMSVKAGLETDIGYPPPPNGYVNERIGWALNRIVSELILEQESRP
jgi:hypothetical protein